MLPNFFRLTPIVYIFSAQHPILVKAASDWDSLVKDGLRDIKMKLQRVLVPR